MSQYIQLNLMGLLRFLCLFLVLHQTNGFTWGVESTACEFFTPSHIGRNRRPPYDYYKLSSNKVMFSPGETIEVKVDGANPKDAYYFKGIMISVRKDGISVGSWQETLDFRHINCNNVYGGALAETDNFPKLVGENVFRWTAPEKCDFEETYTIRATVVKSKREFLDGLSLSLTCVHPSHNRLDDSCTRGYHAIPEGVTTSFEEHYFGGWKNSGDGELQWRTINGSTPSPGTGPNGAYDGDYYMFMEGSYPAKKGQQAILESPDGLAGCLCFRYWYHMYTDENTKFFCSINGREFQCQHPQYVGEMQDAKRNKWVRSWMSINEPGNIKIKIIGERGTTFRGDISLDKFVVTPGICEEDGKMKDSLIL